jgi:hypothetical protein
LWYFDMLTKKIEDCSAESIMDVKFIYRMLRT